MTKTATGRNVEFGYERDLQPTYLEERCGTFFDKPPIGWNADHILLSSGQSAMAAVLHALEGGSLFGGDRKLSFAHLGSYFETAEIFSLFSSLLKAAGRGREAVNAMDELEADIFIIEPIFCDGEFGCVDVAHLIEEHRKRAGHPRVYLFDNTLIGTGFALELELERMGALKPLAVFRLISGLKLFQGGLELSNIGIVSVYTPEEGAISASQLGDRIRRIRTLLGWAFLLPKSQPLKHLGSSIANTRRSTSARSSRTMRSSLTLYQQRTVSSVAFFTLHCCRIHRDSTPLHFRSSACVSTICSPTQP